MNDIGTPILDIPAPIDLPESDRRYAFVWCQKGAMVHWLRTRFANLKKGDVFLLFDPDGTPVESADGQVIFEAGQDAYIDNATGIFTINAQPLGGIPR